MAELLSGVTIQLKDGTQVDAGKHLTGKMVGLYFSASWCKPCCIFTPKLKKFYEKIKQGHPEFEIVLVSRDRDEAALFEYYDKHMGSWTFIPFGHHKIQYALNFNHLPVLQTTLSLQFRELLTLYKVVTIPSMRVIKPDGTVVVQDARSEIQDKGIENPEDLFEEWEAFYM